MDINQRARELISLINKQSIDEYKKYTSMALIPIVEYVNANSVTTQEQITGLAGISFLSFLIGLNTDIIVPDSNLDLIDTITEMVRGNKELLEFFTSIDLGIVATNELDLVEMLEGVELQWY